MYFFFFYSYTIRLFFFFFFFSSRRRHTRLQGDWSSDVCSSDLRVTGAGHFVQTFTRAYGETRVAPRAPGQPAVPAASIPQEHRRMSRRPATGHSTQGIPEATIARLPLYLRVLYACAEQGIATVSSEELAAAAGVNSAKLRKDLSHLGSYGTRGEGYDVDYLVYQVSRELGLTQDWPVVIVGAGNLGRALANYGGFASRGFRIAAVLDVNVAVVGTEIAAGHLVGSAEE